MSYTFLREYFEDGCLCLASGELEVATDVSDKEAAETYIEECQCSRHPDHPKNLRTEA